jgi:hypothetical protein
LPIILMAGAVQVIRRDALDIVVFSGTAVLILVDTQLSHRGSTRGTASHRRMWRLPGGWIPVTLGAGVGVLLGLSGLGSIVARTVLGLVGVLALVLVLRGPPDLAVPPLPRRWPAWAGVTLAIAVWELAAFVSQADPETGNPEHPTLSTLADPALADVTWRCVLWAGWAAGLVWLVRALATGGRPADDVSAAGSACGR